MYSLYFLSFFMIFEKEFMGSNPYLTQVKSEILRYVSFEQEIEDIEPIIILGSIELSTGKVGTVC